MRAGSNFFLFPNVICGTAVLAVLGEGKRVMRFPTRFTVKTPERKRSVATAKLKVNSQRCDLSRSSEKSMGIRRACLKR